MATKDLDFTGLMREALIEAERASARGEVPVGAVVSVSGKIVSRAHNLTESLKDPTAHAEVLALREAAKVVGNWRLSNATLVVTLEPCTMCIGAVRLARVETLVFGAPDKRMGACGTLYDLSLDARVDTPPRVIRGILEEECGRKLLDFFKKRRD